MWLALCFAATLVLVLAALTLPANVAGGCEERGVCVYHMMFCEATRHAAAGARLRRPSPRSDARRRISPQCDAALLLLSVRHPANFWSNLPYVWFSLFLLCQVRAHCWLPTDLRRTLTLTHAATLHPKRRERRPTQSAALTPRCFCRRLPLLASAAAAAARPCTR